MKTKLGNILTIILGVYYFKKDGDRGNKVTLDSI